jgi:hypothetical protein
LAKTDSFAPGATSNRDVGGAARRVELIRRKSTPMIRYSRLSFGASFGLCVFGAFFLAEPAAALEADRALSLSWDKGMLTIHGKHLPGGSLEVWYLEAFCRAGSTRRDWSQTVIPHATERIETSHDGRLIKLRSRVSDGVVVDHEIRAGQDEVSFHVVATNPTNVESQVHWAQPCIRVDKYAGVKLERAAETYLPRCFIYVDGKPARLPTTPWARAALYTPGQVWCPEGVNRDDVNPRPLSSIVPSNGLIGCVSADGKEMMATAWEPYQELFQGVIVCLHSDFRIGGLKPGQSKKIRGKIYLIPANFADLQSRYRRDFPGQERQTNSGAAEKNLILPTKKLIEFGWDEPDTSSLRKYHTQFERSPFDGCVFHVTARSETGVSENFTWLCWGRRQFSAAQFKTALDDLDSIAPSRFRHNFLRFNVTPGDLDWFDDHTAVVNNARLAGKLARSGHCEGILLDTEAYQGKLFDYHKQRDFKSRSWADYAAEARRRGQEVMTAFQEGFPDLTLLVTFGHSFVWKQTQGGMKPMADCTDGLLAPFLDGVIDGASGKSRVIDGHEMSYGYRDAGLFVQARDSITRKACALAADPPKYQSVTSVGFGLWLDYNWPKYGWNAEKTEGNYFSPEHFESSLRAAVEQSDEYVWIYTEKPRWWSDNGGANSLPQSYVDAISRVRRALIEP